MKVNNVLTLGITSFLITTLIGCGPKDGKVQVIYKNADGTVLQTESINVGEDSTYKQESVPSMPIPAGAVANKFIGWDKPLTNIRKNTTFTAQYKKIETYIDKDHDGIPLGVDPDDNNNDFTYGAKSMVYLENQKIKIDFSKFLISEANKTYDNDIAKLGLLMSNPKADFNDGMFTDKSYGSRENALYSRLGCDKWTHFDFKDYAADNYKYDPNDTTSGVYGHKYLVDDNGKAIKDFIFIAFEGTNGPRRWASNFDVGYDDDAGENYNKEYYEKVKREEKGETGVREDHPEWDNHDYHKGFYVAAKRVLAEKVDGGTKDGPVQFIKYIKENTTQGLGLPIVFVTGHSRGGAIANIAGTYLEKYKEYSGEIEDICIPFTYTFASPAPYGKSTKLDTYSIFNVLNNDDIVTKVPFSEWNFVRNGNDIIDRPVKDFESEYNQNREKRLYRRIENSESIFHNLGCTGREQIYHINDEGSDDDKYASRFALNEESYTKKEDADAKVIDLNKEYEEKFGDFFRFIKLKVYKRTTLLSYAYYDIYADCCIGTVTAFAQATMLKNDKVLKNIVSLLPLVANSRFTTFVFSIIVNIINIDPFSVNGDAIGLPHDYGSYTILLNHYVEP